MSRRIIILICAVLAFACVGLIVSYVVKARGMSDDVRCKNNLRELAQFAAHHAAPQPKAPADKFPTQIPAGTVWLPGVLPDDRLSWFVRVLPGVDQKKQNTEPLLAGLDLVQPWAAPKNQTVARLRLLVDLCPANPPLNDLKEPALGSYVGIAGLGLDSPLLALPPAPQPAPPRAGCFRYDSPTPFDAITDGLSQSLLMGERSGDLGPWTRGGSATVRGLDDSPGARPLIGGGGQFGGNHPNGANWGFADGSVRFFTHRVDPKVLFGLATIAGKDNDAIPGE